MLLLLLLLMLQLRAIVGGNCRIIAGKCLRNLQSYPSYKARMNDNRRQNDSHDIIDHNATFLIVVVVVVVLFTSISCYCTACYEGCR